MLGIKNFFNKANNASIMCSNSGVGCCVGCGVSCGKSGSGSGGVDEIVAKGPEDVLKRYVPPWVAKYALYGDGGGGGDGGLVVVMSYD